MNTDKALQQALGLQDLNPPIHRSAASIIDGRACIREMGGGSIGVRGEVGSEGGTGEFREGRGFEKKIDTHMEEDG